MPRAEHECDHGDRHVDEEDRAPAGREQIEADQAAAGERTGDRAQAHHRAEDPERLLLALVPEQLPHEAEALRDHHRRAHPLKRTGRDQRSRRRRERAQRRRGGEAGDPAEQHPPAPEDVAEAAPEQQRDRHRQRVGGRDPLQRGERSAEIALDRGRRGLRDR
jgi:hypothetical protein